MPSASLRAGTIATTLGSPTGAASYRGRFKLGTLGNPAAATANLNTHASAISQATKTRTCIMRQLEWGSQEAEHIGRRRKRSWRLRASLTELSPGPNAESNGR